MKQEPQEQTRPKRRAALAVLAAALLPGLFSGCTSRGMTITSEPEGADVTINRRPVGKTPVRVNYTHYGAYRIEVRKERYRTLVRKEKVRPPWYGYDPFAFFADNLVPARINDESSHHYVLQPIPEDFKRGELLKRAALARQGQGVHPVTHKPFRIAFAARPRRVLETDLMAGAEGPAPGPDLELPAKPEAAPKTPPKGSKPAALITEQKPEGPRIAKKLGIEKEPGKKKKKVTAPKRKRRTPKGEILIYDEPPIENPEKKEKE